MKKLIILMFLACVIPCFGAFTTSIGNRKTYKNAYRWTGKPKDLLLDWAEEVEDALDGTTGINFLLLIPTTEPGTPEPGQLYFDLAANTLKVRNSSAFVALATASGNSLDQSYDAGVAITVDNGAVALTATNAANNVALAIVQADTAGAVAQTIVSAGTGALLSFDSNGTGVDILGSDSSWNISKVGLATLGGGLTISTADVLFDATAAGKDVNWDDSEETMGFLDNAVLGFGNTAASPDVEIAWNASNLIVNSKTEDTGEIQIGPTNAIDLALYGNTNTKIALFNANTATLEFNDYDLQMQDTDEIAFGDGDDWTVASPSAKKVKWTPATGDGSDSFDIGADTAGGDFKLFGADTSGSFALWDSSNDALWLDKADIAFSETDGLLFGDTLGTGDWRVDSTSAVLTFAQVVEDTGTVTWGADGAGVDITWFGEGASAFLKWDGTGADQLILTGIDSSGTLFAITGVDTTGDTDTVSIAHSGAGAGIDFALGSTDSVAIDILAKAAQTTSSVILQGGTGAADWDGADNIGMLHLTHDSAMADAGAAQLLILQETATKSDAEGFLARFISTATAQTGAFAVEVETTNTQPALKLNNQMQIAGADSAGILMKVDGGDVTGDSDTIVVTHRGDASALKITTAEPVGTAIEVVCDAAQTSSAVLVDGTTGAWLGASDVGMLHLKSDGGLASVNASLLFINNTGIPTNDSRGSSLRIVDTGNAGGGTAGYAVYIQATDATVEALLIDDGAVQIDEILTTGIGYQSTVVTKVANSDGGSGSTIDPGTRVVHVTGFTANANDWVLLPSGTIGQRLTIISDVAHEIRTPAASDDTINDVDADGGANEYAVVLDDINDFVCTGTGASWIAVAHDKLGAAKTVAPDGV